MAISRWAAAAGLAAAALLMPCGAVGLAQGTADRTAAPAGLASGPHPSAAPAASRAIPHPAPAPEWLTPALRRRVSEAADHGLAVPLPDDTQVPTTSLLFPGIRPGARMVWPSGCTLSYVFGADADLSIGTAGHCAKQGENVTIVSAPGVLLDIGTVVRSVADGIGNDFALIRIRPSMRRYVNPSMSYAGGPTGTATPRPGDMVVHAGHGLVVGYGGTPRTGVVSYRDGTGFGWHGTAALGDSGSPVRLLDGRAAGGLTHVVTGPLGLPVAAAGITVTHMERIAGLRLATAPPVPAPDMVIPVTGG
jgi:hypothetical protein